MRFGQNAAQKSTAPCEHHNLNAVVEAGIHKDLKIAARRYLCPNCGREFSLFQSRAVACKACPQANQNCPYVRCPFCDKEYPISGFVVPESKEDQVHMSQYADKVFNKWQDSFGNNRR